MRLTAIVFVAFTVLCGCSVAQTTNVPTLKGYEIKFTDVNNSNGKVYLIGYHGGEPYCADSAVVKKGTAVFKNKKSTLPCGVYSFSYTLNARPIADLILNKDNKLTVRMPKDPSVFNQIVVDGSEENSILYDFIYNTPNNTKDIYDYCRKLVETMPDAFVSKFIIATNGANWQQLANSRSQVSLVKILSNVVDFNEPRLLFSPSRLFSMIELPITNEELTEADDIINYIKMLTLRKSCPAVESYIAGKLFKALDTHNPDFDPAMVYLYDHCSKDWIDEDSRGRIQRKVNNLRKLIPGAKVPELISHDSTGNAHSTHDIANRYTVLWFWDPDCDHCQEMTPVLHQLYQEHANDWDFEVFAVEVNNDHDRWITFSDQHELWDWTNLSTSMGEANLDFIEYFDIMTTPVIYLVDNSKEHTIIARQITLDELVDFLNNVEK